VATHLFVTCSSPWFGFAYLCRPAALIGMLPASVPELPKTTEINRNVCKPPTTVFQRWDINTIVAGPDGQPSPIEYTLERKKPHRLTVLDIDARDMRLAVYVDGIMRGMSSDFKLDKSMICGDTIQICLDQNFSTAAVVVPPGRHTVKIVWAGKGENPIWHLRCVSTDRPSRIS
jgi:hypothetical protein